MAAGRARLMAPRGLDVVARFARNGWRRAAADVDQLSHALQCAALARRERADDELVLAALLHDVGQLLGDAPTPWVETPEQHHGRAGAALLRPFAPPRVVWLVAHHVVAKRYVSTLDARYAASVPPTSTRLAARASVALADDERRALEVNAWFADALRIGRWDDEAMDPVAACAPMIAYRVLLEHRFGPQSWTDQPGIGR